MNIFPLNLFTKKHSIVYNIELSRDDESVSFQRHILLLDSFYRELVSLLDQWFESPSTKSNKAKGYIDVGAYKFLSDKLICKTYTPIIHLVITENEEERIKQAFDNCTIENKSLFKINSYSGEGSAFGQSNRKLFKRYSVKRKLYEQST